MQCPRCRRENPPAQKFCGEVADDLDESRRESVRRIGVVSDDRCTGGLQILSRLRRDDNSHLRDAPRRAGSSIDAIAYRPGGRFRSSPGTRLPSPWMIPSIVSSLPFLLRASVRHGRPGKILPQRVPLAMVPRLIQAR
jgi:hypothetical protein